MRIPRLLVLFLICMLLLSTVQVFSQDSAIYNCNVRLITRNPHCDSLRDDRVHPKVNYSKMLKRDRKIIAFLNLYRSDTLSLQKLEDQLQKMRDYYSIARKHNFSDTTSCQLTLTTKGLTNLLIRYRYKDGQILKRFYALQINNPPGAGFSRPLDYHYMIFKLLNFCLGVRYSCYNFEGEF